MRSATEKVEIDYFMMDFPKKYFGFSDEKFIFPMKIVMENSSSKFHWSKLKL